MWYRRNHSSRRKKDSKSCRTNRSRLAFRTTESQQYPSVANVMSRPPIMEIVLGGSIDSKTRSAAAISLFCLVEGLRPRAGIGQGPLHAAHGTARPGFPVTPDRQLTGTPT